MKRSICLLLLPILFLGILGCQQDQPKLQAPVQFYYPRLEPTYGSSDSLIAPVPTESMSYGGDALALLNLYLSGPQDPAFTSPFPSGCRLLSLSVTDGTAYLQLDPSLAQLTGIDLTLACACLTLTAMELTRSEAVCISAKDAVLDGAPQILMDRSCLTLLDVYIPETT